jgi:hypothetical protein
MKYNANISQYYGMLIEYHITEYGRQKILKDVAMRAQRIAVDTLWYALQTRFLSIRLSLNFRGKTPSTSPAIKEHLNNIMDRFRSSRPSKSHAKLLPARSITSLRETVEVHPYLVLAPADLMTMVNTLFPERRPVSKDQFNGLRSAASSISGMSAISRQMPGPRTTFDNASIFSTSGSSVISDTTTSREPLLEDVASTTQRRSPTSIGSARQPQRLSYYEDDAFELRVAVHEMTEALGIDGVSGACHPCAERWAVLFMSPDGEKLSAQMIHDQDDEMDDEEYTSSSDSDDDDPVSRPDLDKDYHQLRDSILKLVEDYEIPQSHDAKSSKTFSNRASALESPRKKKSRSRPGSSAHSQSKNPYRPRDPSPPADLANREDSKSRQQIVSDESEPTSVLISMLEAAGNQCQAQSDFVNAHLYWKTLNQLHQLSSASLRKDGFASLLSIFSRGPRDSIRRSASAIEEYDAWLVWLKQSQERHDISTEFMIKKLKALRDKMWYVTDVRNSAAYGGVRELAIALKQMVSPPKKVATLPPPPGMRPRNIPRLSTNNFLLQNEEQIFKEMAATEEQGGPNKLADDQSENTLRWLSQFGIENFCKGEERIHRFCLGIETCINKLIGDNLMQGPVLWSSELYNRDKNELDSGRKKGDLFLNSFGALNIIGDDSSELESGRRGLRSTDFNRPGTRDLRSISARNTSQQSFDSGRYSMSRISTTGDVMDSQDYFGMSSPVTSVNSNATFWSPFHTRPHSPTTSISSFRPGTSSSTNETVMIKEERANIAKQRFLSDLKQTLTGLLVSDLGTLVFSRGSETDSWFSGDLGQDCMERKERAERRAKRKSKRRTLEKKKSFRDLRNIPRPEIPLERPDAYAERTEKGGSRSARLSSDHSVSDVHSTAESSSTNDTVMSGSRKVLPKEVDSPDFPYRKAFKRLLRMFSVHPNPYAKLDALFELEHLIIAFLTPSAPRKLQRRQDTFASTPHSPEAQHLSAFGASEAPSTTPRAKNLEEAIDNCKERRSHTVSVPNNASPIHRTSERSLSFANPASTDAIVEVLQDLFRDPDIRPKTLFRDLQFIASFVPAAILDKTERGKAFWDAGLAALGLKQDVCRTLIEIADEIVVHYTDQRKATSSNAEMSQPTMASGEVMKYSMQDAAKMWTITAKEGDPVAQRELAIFYLTHPELVERVTAPLSKPKETFKAQVMEMHGGGSAGKEERDRERSDPATMCVAYHWMELSAVGNDELAKKYLRQREELNAIP